MDPISLRDDGSIGVMQSVLSVNCVYCSDTISEQEPVVYLLSAQPNTSDSDKEVNELYLVEFHLDCVSDFIDTLQQFNPNQSTGIELIESGTIRYIHLDPVKPVECIICQNTSQEGVKAITFSTSPMLHHHKENSVWCHIDCYNEIIDSLLDLDEYTDEIVSGII